MPACSKGTEFSDAQKALETEMKVGITEANQVLVEVRPGRGPLSSPYLGIAALGFS